MRVFALLPLALLLAGCLSPGEPDPTRYPWDVRAQVRNQFCVAAHGPFDPDSVIRSHAEPFDLGCAALGETSGARDNAAFARFVRHFRTCTVRDIDRLRDGTNPRRFPAHCVIAGLGEHSPLGPVWVYLPIRPNMSLRIKLRDLMPDEVARLFPRVSARPPMPGTGFACMILLRPQSTNGITVNPNATSMSMCPNVTRPAPKPAAAAPTPGAPKSESIVVTGPGPRGPAPEGVGLPAQPRSLRA